MSTPKASSEEEHETPPDPVSWLDNHGDALFGYAYSRVRDRSVAEDLVQETLLAALHGLDDYAHTSSERTWLTGILRHKLLDHFRRVTRDQALWSEDTPVDESDGEFDDKGRWRAPPAAWSAPESSLDREQFWRTFDGCVDNLPEKLRTPFLLRELDGLETSDLTHLLRVTRNNLWVMLSRARNHLRRCLQRQWFEA